MGERNDESGTQGTSGSGRDKYRDNDDVRQPTPNEDRNEPKPDTKTEARGDSRESIGNTAHKQYGNPDQRG